MADVIVHIGADISQFREEMATMRSEYAETQKDIEDKQIKIPGKEESVQSSFSYMDDAIARAQHMISSVHEMGTSLPRSLQQAMSVLTTGMEQSLTDLTKYISKSTKAIDEAFDMRSYNNGIRFASSSLISYSEDLNKVITLSKSMSDVTKDIVGKNHRQISSLVDPTLSHMFTKHHREMKDSEIISELLHGGEEYSYVRKALTQLGLNNEQQQRQAIDFALKTSKQRFNRQDVQKRIFSSGIDKPEGFTFATDVVKPTYKNAYASGGRYISEERTPRSKEESDRFKQLAYYEGIKKEILRGNTVAYKAAKTARLISEKNGAYSFLHNDEVNDAILNQFSGHVVAERKHATEGSPQYRRDLLDPNNAWKLVEKENRRIAESDRLIGLDERPNASPYIDPRYKIRPHQSAYEKGKENQHLSPALSLSELINIPRMTIQNKDGKAQFMVKTKDGLRPNIDYGWQKSDGITESPFDEFITMGRNPMLDRIISIHGKDKSSPTSFIDRTFGYGRNEDDSPRQGTPLIISVTADDFRDIDKSGKLKLKRTNDATGKEEVYFPESSEKLINDLNTGKVKAQLEDGTKYRMFAGHTSGSGSMLFMRDADYKKIEETDRKRGLTSMLNYFNEVDENGRLINPETGYAYERGKDKQGQTIYSEEELAAYRRFYDARNKELSHSLPIEEVGGRTPLAALVNFGAYYKATGTPKNQQFDGGAFISPEIYSKDFQGRMGPAKFLAQRLNWRKYLSDAGFTYKGGEGEGDTAEHFYLPGMSATARDYQIYKTLNDQYLKGNKELKGTIGTGNNKETVSMSRDVFKEWRDNRFVDVMDEKYGMLMADTVFKGSPLKSGLMTAEAFDRLAKIQEKENPNSAFLKARISRPEEEFAKGVKHKEMIKLTPEQQTELLSMYADPKYGFGLRLMKDTENYAGEKNFWSPAYMSSVRMTPEMMARSAKNYAEAFEQMSTPEGIIKRMFSGSDYDSRRVQQDKSLLFSDPSIKYKIAAEKEDLEMKQLLGYGYFPGMSQMLVAGVNPYSVFNPIGRDLTGHDAQGNAAAFNTGKHGVIAGSVKNDGRINWTRSPYAPGANFFAKALRNTALKQYGLTEDSALFNIDDFYELNTGDFDGDFVWANKALSTDAEFQRLTEERNKGVLKIAERALEQKSIEERIAEKKKNNPDFDPTKYTEALNAAKESETGATGLGYKLTQAFRMGLFTADEIAQMDEYGNDTYDKGIEMLKKTGIKLQSPNKIVREAMMTRKPFERLTKSLVSEYEKQEYGDTDIFDYGLPTYIDPMGTAILASAKTGRDSSVTYGKKFEEMVRKNVEAKYHSDESLAVERDLADWYADLIIGKGTGKFQFTSDETLQKGRNLLSNLETELASREKKYGENDETVKRLRDLQRHAIGAIETEREVGFTESNKEDIARFNKEMNWSDLSRKYGFRTELEARVADIMYEETRDKRRQMMEEAHEDQLEKAMEAATGKVKGGKNASQQMMDRILGAELYTGFNWSNAKHFVKEDKDFIKDFGGAARYIRDKAEPGKDMVLEDYIGALRTDFFANSKENREQIARKILTGETKPNAFLEAHGLVGSAGHAFMEEYGKSRTRETQQASEDIAEEAFRSFLLGAINPGTGVRELTPEQKEAQGRAQVSFREDANGRIIVDSPDKAIKSQIQAKLDAASIEDRDTSSLYSLTRGYYEDSLTGRGGSKMIMSEGQSFRWDTTKGRMVPYGIPQGHGGVWVVPQRDGENVIDFQRMKINANGDKEYVDAGTYFTPDMIKESNGKITIADWKSGAGGQADALFQTAYYAHLLEQKGKEYWLGSRSPELEKFARYVNYDEENGTFTSNIEKLEAINMFDEGPKRILQGDYSMELGDAVAKWVEGGYENLSAAAKLGFIRELKDDVKVDFLRSAMGDRPVLAPGEDEKQYHHTDYTPEDVDRMLSTWENIYSGGTGIKTADGYIDQDKAFLVYKYGQDEEKLKEIQKFRNQQYRRLNNVEFDSRDEFTRQMEAAEALFSPEDAKTLEEYFKAGDYTAADAYAMKREFSAQQLEAQSQMKQIRELRHQYFEGKMFDSMQGDYDNIAYGQGDALYKLRAINRKHQQDLSIIEEERKSDRLYDEKVFGGFQTDESALYVDPQLKQRKNESKEDFEKRQTEAREKAREEARLKAQLGSETAKKYADRTRDADSMFERATKSIEEQIIEDREKEQNPLSALLKGQSIEQAIHGLTTRANQYKEMAGTTNQFGKNVFGESTIALFYDEQERLKKQAETLAEIKENNPFLDEMSKSKSAYAKELIRSTMTGEDVDLGISKNNALYDFAIGYLLENNKATPEELTEAIQKYSETYDKNEEERLGFGPKINKALLKRKKYAEREYENADRQYNDLLQYASPDDEDNKELIREAKNKRDHAQELMNQVKRDEQEVATKTTLGAMKTLDTYDRAFKTSSFTATERTQMEETLREQEAQQRVLEEAERKQAEDSANQRRADELRARLGSHEITKDNFEHFKGLAKEVIQDPDTLKAIDKLTYGQFTSGRLKGISKDAATWVSQTATNPLAMELNKYFDSPLPSYSKIWGEMLQERRAPLEAELADLEARGYTADKGKKLLPGQYEYEPVKGPSFDERVEIENLERTLPFLKERMKNADEVYEKHTIEDAKKRLDYARSNRFMYLSDEGTQKVIDAEARINAGRIRQDQLSRIQQAKDQGKPLYDILTPQESKELDEARGIIGTTADRASGLWNETADMKSTKRIDSKKAEATEMTKPFGRMLNQDAQGWIINENAYAQEFMNFDAARARVPGASDISFKDYVKALKDGTIDQNPALKQISDIMKSPAELAKLSNLDKALEDREDVFRTDKKYQGVIEERKKGVEEAEQNWRAHSDASAEYYRAQNRIAELKQKGAAPVDASGIADAAKEAGEASVDAVKASIKATGENPAPVNAESIGQAASETAQQSLTQEDRDKAQATLQALQTQQQMQDQIKAFEAIGGEDGKNLPAAAKAVYDRLQYYNGMEDKGLGVLTQQNMEDIKRQRDLREDAYDQRISDLTFGSSESQIRRDESYEQQRRQAWGGSHSRFANSFMRQEQIRKGLEATVRANDHAAQKEQTNLNNLLKKQEEYDKQGISKKSDAYKENSQKIAEATQNLQDYKKASEDANQQMLSFGTGSNLMRAGLSSVNDTMGMLLKRFGRQMFMKAINEAKTFVKQFDKTMTEIQMITLKSDEQMATLGDGIISKAKEMKVSIAEVSQSAATLYRQGLNDEEVDKRLGVISKFSRVSGTKVADATKLITVAMNTGLVSNAMEASDIVTALGDNAATNAQQIEKGIEKAGAAAAADGTTFGQLAAMLTAITSTTQIGGNVAGRTLNTIFGRMNKIGTNELITDENGNQISGSAVAKLLAKQGINQYDENGKKRSSFDTLYALSQKWEGMSDAEQQQMANAIAGTRQYSNFAAIMQGMTEGKIDEYLNLLGESSGITDKKFDVYTKSLEANLTDLKNTFDSTINNLVDKNVFSEVTDGLKNMITGIGSLVSTAGGLQGVILPLATLAVVMAGIRGGAAGAIAMGGIIAGLGIATSVGMTNSAKSETDIKNAKIEDANSSYSSLLQSVNTAKMLTSKENLTENEKIQLKESFSDIALMEGIDTRSDSFVGLMNAIDGASSSAINASTAINDYANSIIETANKTIEAHKMAKLFDIDYGTAVEEKIKEEKESNFENINFDNPLLQSIVGQAYNPFKNDYLNGMSATDLSKKYGVSVREDSNGQIHFDENIEDYEKIINMPESYQLTADELIERMIPHKIDGRIHVNNIVGGLFKNAYKGLDYTSLSEEDKKYAKYTDAHWFQYVNRLFAGSERPTDSMMQHVNDYLNSRLPLKTNTEKDIRKNSFKEDLKLFNPDLTGKQLDALAEQAYNVRQDYVKNGFQPGDAYNNALFSIVGTSPDPEKVKANIEKTLMTISPDLLYDNDSTIAENKTGTIGLGNLVSSQLLTSKDLGYKNEYTNLLRRARGFNNIGALGATNGEDYKALIETSNDKKLIEIWQDLQNNTGKYNYNDLVSYLEQAVYGGSGIETKNKMLNTASTLSQMNADLGLMKATSGGSESLFKTISSATGLDINWIRENYDAAVVSYESEIKDKQRKYEQGIKERIAEDYDLTNITDKDIDRINKEYADYGVKVSKNKKTGSLDYSFTDIGTGKAYKDLYDYSKIFTKDRLAEVANKVKGLSWDEAINQIGENTWSEDELTALSNYSPDLIKYMKMTLEQRATSEGQKLLENAQNQIALDSIDTSTVSGVQQYSALKYQQNNKAGLAANRIYESMNQFNPEGIQSLGDLSNVLSSGNVDDWKTLLENNDELAKKMADAGITFDETSGKFDTSGLVGGAEAASSALQSLAVAVAGASEAYSKQQEVLSEGETRERALAYSGGSTIDEELGFAAYSEAIGNSKLAQVVRNNRVAYDEQMQAYNDYMALSLQERKLREAEGEKVSKPGEFDAFEGLTDYEREYAQALEQNLAEGITGGLTAEQREEQTQKLLEAAQKGPEALQQMRSQDSIGAIQDYLTGIENGENLLNDIAKGGKNAELALKKFQEQVSDRQAANLTKYSKNGSNLATALSKIKKGGKDASEGMAILRKDMKKYQDQMTAVSNAKGMSGKQLDAQTKEILASLFDNISAEDIKQMSKEELTDLLQGSEDEINAAFTESLQAIMDQGVADAKATGIDFDLSSVKINANGSPDFSSLDPAIAEILNAAWAKLQALAGTIGTAEIQEITSDNFMKLVGVVTKGNGYNSGGGGGGGGGKSKVDALIEKQQRKTEKLQHKQNMNQIYEGQYDYNNDYSGLNANYNAQISQEQKLRDQHLKNIAKYKKMLKKTKKPEDRKKLQQQIEKEEEEAAKAQNNINEIIKKQRITAVDERLTNRAKPLDQQRSMLDIYASRAEIRGNFNDYMSNSQAAMEANKQKQAMNNEDINEWKNQLAQVAKGSDTWIEIRDKIYAKEQENAQLENDYLQKQNELVQKRLENIAKQLQQTSQVAQHNIGISDIYGSYYETAGYRREYEETIREKQENNLVILARNEVALQEAYDELERVENNPELGKYSDRWYEVEEAINQYLEAIAQTNVDQRQLETAKLESNLAGIAEAFSDATSEITHTNDALSKFAEYALEINDFDTYYEAQNRIIENTSDKVSAAYTQVLRNRALFNELNNSDNVDPEELRKARDAMQEAENTYLEAKLEADKANRELIKNTVDYYVKQSDFELSNLEHNKKLFDYSASQYQSRGEWTNYGEALKANNVLEEMTIQIHKDRIEVWDDLIKTTAKGSEEEKQLVELKKKDEEAIASSTATIEKNTKALEDNIKKINQAAKALQDSVDKQIEAEKKRQREMLAANVSMQDTILNVLRKRLQEEWDLKKKDIEKEKESLNEYKKLINERFNYRKKASQQADKDEELADYRRQLALIEADPTRTKDAKELRRKIEDLEKQKAWTVAEDELNVENKRIDDQIDGMNKFVQYNEQLLKQILGDANNFYDQMSELTTGTFEESYQKIVDFMEQANSEFAKKLPDAQKQLLQNLKDTWKKARGIIDNNFEEISKILGIYDDETGEIKSYDDLNKPEYLKKYIDYMKETDVYYKSAVENEDWVTAQKYELEWNEIYKNFLSSIKNDFTFTMDDHSLREVESIIESLEDNIFKVDIVNIDNALSNAMEPFGYLDEHGQYVDYSTGETPTTSDYMNIGKDPSKVEKIKTSSSSDGGSNSSGSGSSGNNKKNSLNRYGYTTTDTRGYPTSQGGTVYASNTTSARSKATSDIKNKWGSTRLLNSVYQYEKGGLVDYTGPAWVDGTKTKPEAFLSAIDTENIRSFLDAFNYVMSTPYMSNYDASAYGNTTNIGDVNITINQAELASDADVNKLAKQVGQAFSKELQRNGLNLAGYAFG